MSAFKISIDEDLLLIRTSPSILNYVMLFKHWSYHIELPVQRIVRTEVERRMGILTLIVVKRTKGGADKNIALSLVKANRKQVDFIKYALPKIINEWPPMNEIKEYIKKYLK